MTRLTAKRVVPATLLIAVALLAPSSSSQGATVKKMSTQDLVKLSEVIVLGKVVAQQGRRLEDGTHLTDVTLDVTAFVKSGDATQKTFTFPIYGGTVDGITKSFSGQTKYIDGEDVLLFLEAPHPKLGYRHTIGMAQGKFTVQVEPGTGKKYLVRDLGGIQLAGPNGRLEEPKTNEPRLYLEAFIQEIKGYLGTK